MLKPRFESQGRCGGQQSQLHIFVYRLTPKERWLMAARAASDELVIHVVCMKWSYDVSCKHRCPVRCGGITSSVCPFPVSSRASLYHNLQPYICSLGIHSLALMVFDRALVWGSPRIAGNRYEGGRRYNGERLGECCWECQRGINIAAVLCKSISMVRMR